MIRYSIGFLLLVIVAAIFAFGGFSVRAASIAEGLFYISLPLFVISSLLVALMFKKHIVEKKQIPIS